MIIEENQQIRKQSILFVNREKGINGILNKNFKNAIQNRILYAVDTFKLY